MSGNMFHLRFSAFFVHLMLMLVRTLSPSVTSLKLLSLSDGEALCSMDPPSKIVPLSDFDNSQSAFRFSCPSCVPALAKCAWICTQQTNCTSYNYNATSVGCELFFYTSINYASIATCSHFKTKTEECSSVKDILTPSAGVNVRKLIPGQCCSFPFTYNGQLYHECAQNTTDAVDVGCFLVNRTWVGCLPPTDFVAKYEIMNITVFNFTGITSVMSINNWIIIQQRLNATPTFSGLWADYKEGFGNFSGNYWFGLEKVYQLTNTGSYRLRIEVETLDNGTWFSTEYNTFVIDSEANFYAIHVDGYSGDGGDAFNYHGNAQQLGLHNGMKFSTVDSAYDKCASRYGDAGFWYHSCLYICLTCSTSSTKFIWRMEKENATLTYKLRSYRMMMTLS